MYPEWRTFLTARQVLCHGMLEFWDSQRATAQLFLPCLPSFEPTDQFQESLKEGCKPQQQLISKYLAMDS